MERVTERGFYVLYYWDVCCSYWLVEREGNGKDYRKGVLCFVMCCCVLELLVGGKEGIGKGYGKGFYVCCRYWLLEGEVDGKGYRKVVLCVVMW